MTNNVLKDNDLVSFVANKTHLDQTKIPGLLIFFRMWRKKTLNTVCILDHLK